MRNLTPCWMRVKPPSLTQPSYNKTAACNNDPQKAKTSASDYKPSPSLPFFLSPHTPETTSPGQHTTAFCKGSNRPCNRRTVAACRQTGSTIYCCPAPPCQIPHTAFFRQP